MLMTRSRAFQSGFRRNLTLPSILLYSTVFGLTDKPLEWLRSLLANHTLCTHCVASDSSRSAWVHATFRGLRATKIHLSKTKDCCWSSFYPDPATGRTNHTRCRGRM